MFIHSILPTTLWDTWFSLSPFWGNLGKRSNMPKVLQLIAEPRLNPRQLVSRVCAVNHYVILPLKKAHRPSASLNVTLRLPSCWLMLSPSLLRPRAPRTGPDPRSFMQNGMFRWEALLVFGPFRVDMLTVPHSGAGVLWGLGALELHGLGSNFQEVACCHLLLGLYYS